MRTQTCPVCGASQIQVGCRGDRCRNHGTAYREFDGAMRGAWGRCRVAGAAVWRGQGLRAAEQAEDRTAAARRRRHAPRTLGAPRMGCSIGDVLVFRLCCAVRASSPPLCARLLCGARGRPPDFPLGRVRGATLQIPAPSCPPLPFPAVGRRAARPSATSACSWHQKGAVQDACGTLLNGYKHARYCNSSNAQGASVRSRHGKPFSLDAGSTFADQERFPGRESLKAVAAMPSPLRRLPTKLHEDVAVLSVAVLSVMALQRYARGHCVLSKMMQLASCKAQ